MTSCDWSDTASVMVKLTSNQFVLCPRVYRSILHWSRRLIKVPHGYPVLQSSLATGEEKYALEGLTKLTIEDTVYDRVHRTVHVPKPREYGEDERRYTSGAERPYDVNREEGCPAEQKYPHDDTEGNSGLVVGHFVYGGAVHCSSHPAWSGYPPVGADRRWGVLARQADVFDVSTSIEVKPVVDEDHGEAG